MKASETHALGSTRPPRVLAMDIDIRGHHPCYVRNFAKTWVDHAIPGQLDLLVSHQFFELHREETEFVQSLASHGVRIHALTQAEGERMESVPLLRHFRAWKLFCQYAASLQCDHALLMYSDYFQLPMLMGRASPCPFSMIYFRPTFHFPMLANYQQSWNERFRAWRKKRLLLRVLRVAKLKRLYCLDGVAVEFMKKHFQTQVSIEFLPDSFSTYPVTAQALDALRLELGIDVSRKVFCLVGALDRRKGVRELLEAVLALGEADAKRVCVLLVGMIHRSHKPEILALLEQIQRTSAAQVLVRDDFVPEQDIQKFYELSDVTLTTYQKHMGGSAALIRSALAKRPILSSNYGLIGEIVRKRQLGLTVDSTQPLEIANGIRAFLADKPECKLDLQSALEFVDENSAARLAEALTGMTILKG